MDLAILGDYEGKFFPDLLEWIRQREGLCRKCGHRVGLLGKMFGQGTDHKRCSRTPAWGSARRQNAR